LRRQFREQANLKKLALGAGLFAAAALGPSSAWSEDFRYPVMESLPPKIEAKVAKKHIETLSALKAIPQISDANPYLVVLESKKWNDGQTVTVAFKGGTKELHEKIANAAAQWSNYANIRFDFGRDPATGEFRKWSGEGSDYPADIRIGFDQQGYWSIVGTESVDPDILPATDASMNFEGFDKELPKNWEGVVKHEFGHALGLEHEHQHPAHPCDWRWTDDEGYEVSKDKYGQIQMDKNGKHPSIYRVLGGPPNNWPPEQVDFNLRQLTDSSAYGFGTFDKFSIMKYYFPGWMFMQGEQSDCYSPGGNNDFSDEDKARIAAFYPKDPDAAKKQKDEQVSQITRLAPQVDSSPALSSRLRSKLKQLQ